jgi:Rho-binding antiterminator
MNTEYRPISCEFHDVLEALATTRRAAHIRFRAADGTEQERTASVQDVFARAGAEYLVTGAQETLRLDQLISVDGLRLEDAPDTGT